MYKMSVIIFAGGKSSRMGKDKSQLAFAGYSSLSEYQYHRLGTLFEKVYLSAKSDKFEFGCEVIADNYEVHSPLAALISVFEKLDVPEVFILSVDAPFVDEHVIDTLMNEERKEYDIVIAESPNGLEPLCGIYRRSILPEATKMLKSDNHRLTTLLENVETKKVRFTDKEPFLNLNHPEEYQEALRRLL
ncbi:molybdenum cofactor guanylyltransferase MobA [Sulfurovum sp. zt1-1]|uniref:Probable molybdenum cofactor guanylyltransferase n=1 Tax=Sulfurovum zhangzhouensis TaxID=3019067 RepID=A0ABT7R0J9_9BACT|nr:molybdenum cofactor guanylyltransferase MobA [Sulfurovum zhangzhouensis]MDM5272607.1 molybdenum cofactor guanylyltransferase MobA [Sulfurovum zhangzhouensis]